MKKTAQIFTLNSSELAAKLKEVINDTLDHYTFVPDLAPQKEMSDAFRTWCHTHLVRKLVHTWPYTSLHLGAHGWTPEFGARHDIPEWAIQALQNGVEVRRLTTFDMGNRHLQIEMKVLCTMHEMLLHMADNKQMIRASKLNRIAVDDLQPRLAGFITSRTGKNRLPFWPGELELSYRAGGGFSFWMMPHATTRIKAGINASTCLFNWAFVPVSFYCVRRDSSPTALGYFHTVQGQLYGGFGPRNFKLANNEELMAATLEWASSKLLKVDEGVVEKTTPVYARELAQFDLDFATSFYPDRSEKNIALEDKRIAAHWRYNRTSFLRDRKFVWERFEAAQRQQREAMESYWNAHPLLRGDRPLLRDMDGTTREAFVARYASPGVDLDQESVTLNGPVWRLEAAPRVRQVRGTVDAHLARVAEIEAAMHSMGRRIQFASTTRVRMEARSARQQLTQPPPQVNLAEAIARSFRQNFPEVERAFRQLSRFLPRLQRDTPPAPGRIDTSVTSLLNEISGPAFVTLEPEDRSFEDEVVRSIQDQLAEEGRTVTGRAVMTAANTTIQGATSILDIQRMSRLLETFVTTPLTPPEGMRLGELYTFAARRGGGRSRFELGPVDPSAWDIANNVLRISVSFDYSEFELREVASRLSDPEPTTPVNNSTGDKPPEES